MSGTRHELGIEVIVEPGIVPRGTFDLRTLDAAPGTPAPAVRVSPDGRVERLLSAAEFSAPPPRRPEGVTGAITGIVAPAPAPAPAHAPAPTHTHVPAAPAPAAPAPVPAAAAAPAPAAAAPNEAVLASNGAAGDVASEKTGVLKADAAEVEAAGVPLGAKLRKRSSALPVQSAMPPRPASASENASSRVPGAPLGAEDYETAQISGGFASALGTLVKVTCVLACVTLGTVLTYLYWTGDWPWPTAAAPTVAEAPRAPALVKPRELKPDVAVVPSAVAAKPDTSATATASVAAAGLGVSPETSSSKPSIDVAKASVGDDHDPGAATPQVSGSMDADSDVDIHKVEELRREAVLLYRAGKLDDAMKKLEAILALNPKDADALFRKGLIVQRKGDLPAAALAYQAAAAVAPRRDARAWNNLGLVREAQGDLKAARAAYESGLANDPESPLVLVNLGRLERDKNPAEALARFDAALESDRENSYAHFNRGKLLAALDRVEEGKAELEKLASRDDPMRAEALDALGSIAQKSAKPAEAVAYYRRALEANPNLDEARLHLGVALYAAGDNGHAESELRSYLDKNKTSADAWKTLGCVLVRLDRLSEAKVAYEKALEKNKNDASTLYDYALCAERFGNFLFAIQEYERVIQLEPGYWQALKNLGRLNHRAGRDQKALDYFERAIAIQPRDAELHLHRANSLVALGRQAEARTALAEFVKLAPPGDKRVPEAKRAIESSGGLSPAHADASPAGEQKGF